MGSLEDVSVALAENGPLVLACTALAWFFGFVQIVEAVRLGERDRAPGQPIAMTVSLLALDSTFLMHGPYWLNNVRSEYFTGFWLAMGPAVLIELHLLWRAFGFISLSPGLGPWGAGCVLGLGLASAYGLVWLFQAWTADPLFLTSLFLTQVVAVAFNIPRLVSSGSVRGQSRLFAWAALLGPSGAGLALLALLSPVFRSGLFAGVSAVLLLLSALYLILFERFRLRALAMTSP